MVSSEIRFPDFFSPLLRMGGFVKYAARFLMEKQVIEILLTNQEN